jgi:hypothetical protein
VAAAELLGETAVVGTVLEGLDEGLKLGKSLSRPAVVVLCVGEAVRLVGLAKGAVTGALVWIVVAATVEEGVAATVLVVVGAAVAAGATPDEVGVDVEVDVPLLGVTVALLETLLETASSVYLE